MQTTAPSDVDEELLNRCLALTVNRHGEVAMREIYSPDFTWRILTIVQGKGKQDRIIPVGERALWWIQAMPGHRNVGSTQIYTQVSIRALQAVHASTHPAEQREEDKPDRPENNGHNDTTPDTTKGARDGHNPLQNK